MDCDLGIGGCRAQVVWWYRWEAWWATEEGLGGGAVARWELELLALCEDILMWDALVEARDGARE